VRLLGLTAQPFLSSHDAGNLPWVIVGAYALAATLAVFSARAARTSGERLFWWIAALMLLFLCLNKQFDLQTYLTDFFRQMSRTQGWYQKRRLVQVAFIGVVAVTTLGVGVYLVMLTISASVGVRLAMVGLVMLAAYIVLRAASFHHLDSALGRMVNGVKVHNYVELSCILVVIVGAGLPILLPRVRRD
jgi:hypothetical protein